MTDHQNQKEHIWKFVSDDGDCRDPNSWKEDQGYIEQFWGCEICKITARQIYRYDVTEFYKSDTIDDDDQLEVFDENKKLLLSCEEMQIKNLLE